MTAILKLDEEYQLTRAALVNAGIDMTDSMDTLYREWRRCVMNRNPWPQSIVSE